MPRAAPLLIAALLACACTYRGLADHSGPDLPDEAPPLAYYDAPGPVPDAVERRVERTTRDWILEHVDIPPRLPDELAAVPRASDPIEVLHYRPRHPSATKLPVILMSPILANSNVLVDHFAESFARSGYHAAIVRRKELEVEPGATLRLAEAETRLLVMRSRQVVDWFLARDDVDPDRLGTFGISAGSIVSAMLAGADPRLTAHVWLLAGGPLADVMMDSDEGGLQERRADATRALGLDHAALREGFRDAIRTDPVALAPRVGRDRVLLVLARHDQAVPFRYGLTLWEALGRPERIVLPTGHYTAFVFLPYVEDIAQAFFRRKLP